MTAKADRVVSGYVVKREYLEEDPSDPRIAVKRRVEIGRVFHARGAAETLLAMLKKEHPDWELYIHEKNKRDTATLFPRG